MIFHLVNIIHVIMLFNSMAFLIFLPIVFALHWLVPQKYRCLVLLLASYYFYMSWNPKYVILILTTTVVSYFSGIIIEKRQKDRSAKLVVVGATIFFIGLLFIFKYFNFFYGTLSSFASLFAIHLHPITLNLLLPVGISFYTFQTLSYVFDVYAGKTEAEHNLGIFATFISFFPQLVAGPIERTNKLLPQIKTERKFDYDSAMYGVRLMLWGFFKKIAVADVAASYVDRAFDNLAKCTSLDLCVITFFFTIQIYCDFSGYSDIAIGTANLFGIKLTRNFYSPYFSISAKEFWSRWHISLSTWFRDYVYIPLGGNKKSKYRTNVNVIITFLASGLWHGANWTFVFWGLIHGSMQVFENMFTNKNKRPISSIGKFFRWILLFILINISWIFFRAESISDAIYVIKRVFGGLQNPREFLHTNIGLGANLLLYSFMVITMVFVFDYFSLKFDVIHVLADKNRILIISLEYFILSLILVAMIIGAGANQFVYFQF